MEEWLGWKVTPWGINEIYYQYSVSGFPRWDCRSYIADEEGVYTKAGDRRKFRKVRGVAIDIDVGGAIYYWDSWKACLSLTFLFTLLKIYQMVLELVLARYTTWFEKLKFQTFDYADQDASEDVRSPGPTNEWHA